MSRKEKTTSTEKSLLRDSGDFGLTSIRKAVVSKIMIGINLSILRANEHYNTDKEFTTEDYLETETISNLEKK